MPHRWHHTSDRREYISPLIAKTNSITESQIHQYHSITLLYEKKKNRKKEQETKKTPDPNVYAVRARTGESPSENPFSNTKAFYTISKSSSSSSSSITRPPAATVPKDSRPGSRMPLSRAKRARFLGLELPSWLMGLMALREGCGCG